MPVTLWHRSCETPVCDTVVKEVCRRNGEIPLVPRWKDPSTHTYNLLLAEGSLQSNKISPIIQVKRWPPVHIAWLSCISIMSRPEWHGTEQTAYAPCNHLPLHSTIQNDATTPNNVGDRSGQSECRSSMVAGDGMGWKLSPTGRPNGQPDTGDNFPGAQAPSADRMSQA